LANNKKLIGDVFMSEVITVIVISFVGIVVGIVSCFFTHILIKRSVEKKEIKYLQNNLHFVDDSILKIRLNFGESNKLYQLGIFSLCLNELLISLDFIERNEIRNLKKFYDQKNRLWEETLHTDYRIFREQYFDNDDEYPYWDYYKYYSDKFIINNIQNGSIEIIISGIGVAAAFVMPIIAIKIKEMIDDRKMEPLKFNIETKFSKDINEILNRRVSHKGYFDRETLDYLIDELSANGYNTEWIGENIIEIKKTIDVYVEKMIRIFDSKLK
jgi:hypothetical protein